MNSTPTLPFSRDAMTIRYGELMRRLHYDGPEVPDDEADGLCAELNEVSRRLIGMVKGSLEGVEAITLPDGAIVVMDYDYAKPDGINLRYIHPRQIRKAEDGWA
jgi:hypothetical protein